MGKWYCKNCNFSTRRELKIISHRKICKKDYKIIIKGNNNSEYKLIFFMVDDKCLDDYFNSMKYFFNEIIVWYFNITRYNLKKYEKFIKDNKNNKTFFVLIYADMMYKDEENLFDGCNLFYLNIEQLSRKKHLKYVLNKNIKLLDYSFENVNILKKHNKTSLYFPHQVNMDNILNYDKIYDVAIIGELKNCKRRRKIYQELKKRKVNIINILGWSKERDNKLFRSKIILNIHYSDNYKIFEEIRCNRCIFNKIIVLTEDSDNIDEFMFRDNIVVSNYNDIRNKTIEIIDNYEKYYKKLFEKFDLNNINNDLIEILKNNINYIYG